MNPDMDATAAPIRVGAQEALSASPALPPLENREVVFGIRGGSVHYGSHLALKDVDIDIYRNFVTAFIGPSGCGKSTFLRCLNRLNDLIPSAKVSRRRPLPRRGPLRLGRRPGRGAQAHRHGVPEAEPVSEVDLRQHARSGRACSA